MEKPPLSGPFLPPRSGLPPKQLVVFLHGYGSDGNDLISLADEFADALPDAYFISPNAPSRCEMMPYGYQWFPLEYWTPDALLNGVRGVVPVLNAALDALLAQHGLKDENLALIGFSQGVMTSLFAALRRPRPCAAVLGYSGALIGADVLGAEITAHPPVCLVHGTMDMVVPYAALGEARLCLEENGVPVVTLTRPGLGHGIDMQGIEAGKTFLKRVFGQE